MSNSKYDMDKRMTLIKMFINESVEHTLYIFIYKIRNMVSWLKKCIINLFQILALWIVKNGEIPRHIAIIADGNRRYARTHNMILKEGYVKGMAKVMETIKWGTILGIVEFTVFAFGIENFKRSEYEINSNRDVFRQLLKEFLEDKDRLNNKGMCVRVIGNFSMIPEDIMKLIAEVMFITKKNNRIIMNFAFPYSSSDEITHTIKDIAKGVKDTDILPKDINEDLFTNCLYTYKSLNLDLLIRTSETRLSNFLMWQVSDSCIYFSKVLWPEFSLWDLLRAIYYYQRCYPDLQKIRNKNSKQIVRNSRASTYIDKLHNEREIVIEKIYLSSIQSEKQVNALPVSSTSVS